MNDTSDSKDRVIIHRELDTASDPVTAVAETVADLKGCSTTELGSMYDSIDGVLDHIFSNPPSPDAQVQVSFTYENYRITVEQDGSARFVEVGDSAARG